MTDAEKLAREHWRYTGNLLKLALKLAKFLYVQAFIHGVKHGKEDRFNVHSTKD